jgi:hypothetical protein
MDRTARTSSSSRSRSQPYPTTSRSPRSHAASRSGGGKRPDIARKSNTSTDDGAITTGGSSIPGSSSSTPSRSRLNADRSTSRRTTPDDEPPFSMPGHYCDIDILVQMKSDERRQPSKMQLKRLALRWATGAEKGKVATLKDVDPGRQHGTCLFRV